MIDRKPFENELNPVASAKRRLPNLGLVPTLATDSLPPALERRMVAFRSRHLGIPAK